MTTEHQFKRLGRAKNLFLGRAARSLGIYKILDWLERRRKIAELSALIENVEAMQIEPSHKYLDYFGVSPSEYKEALKLFSKYPYGEINAFSLVFGNKLRKMKHNKE